MRWGEGAIVMTSVPRHKKVSPLLSAKGLGTPKSPIVLRPHANVNANALSVRQVLSVNKALSIQSHPDKELAQRLHARSPKVSGFAAAGVP